LKNGRKVSVFNYLTRAAKNQKRIGKIKNFKRKEKNEEKTFP